MPRIVTRRKTTTTANGTRVVTTSTGDNDNVPEWKIQAEAIRRLKRLPGYGGEAGPDVTFAIAGDFNSGRRGGQEATKAKATGLTAGEEDIRVYGAGGKLLLIEMKGPATPVSADQKKRHALHRHLGFDVHVVRGKTVDKGASDVVDIVSKWLKKISLAA